MASRTRNVKTTSTDTNSRPRDRAIREAAENSQTYTYPQTTYTPNPSYQTVDQQFSDSYNQQGLQPSVGQVASPTRNVTVERRNATRAVGTTARTTGATMQVAGMATQVAGKGLRAAGSGVTRAGAALSSTGIGAIVGVPLAATGVAMQGAGTGLNVAGKATSRAGRISKRFGKKLRGRKGKLNPLDAAVAIKEKIRVTRVNIMIMSAGASIYTTIQLPAAIIATVFLGVMYMVGYFQATIKGVIGETLYSWGEYVFGGLIDIVSQILGFDLLSLINPGTFFALAHLVAVLIGIATLIGTAITYQISLINCLGGEASTKKIVSFVAALCLYILPVFNIFPWVLIWMFVVWKHPE